MERRRPWADDTGHPLSAPSSPRRPSPPAHESSLSRSSVRGCVMARPSLRLLRMHMTGRGELAGSPGVGSQSAGSGGSDGFDLELYVEAFAPTRPLAASPSSMARRSCAGGTGAAQASALRARLRVPQGGGSCWALPKKASSAFVPPTTTTHHLSGSHRAVCAEIERKHPRGRLGDCPLSAMSGWQHRRRSLLPIPYGSPSRPSNEAWQAARRG